MARAGRAREGRVGAEAGDRRGSAASPQACTNSGTVFTTDTVLLPEVNTAAKANGLVIKLYYWISPLCGGAGNPACVKSVTDRAQVTFSYYLD